MSSEEKVLTYYCYVLQAGPFVKIGYTVNLDSRFEAIQTACPYEVSVVCLFPYTTEDLAREMEISLHRKFSKFRVRGEWFKKNQVLDFFRKNGKHV